MKTRSLLLALAFALSALLSPTTNARRSHRTASAGLTLKDATNTPAGVDITARPAIYFTGEVNDNSKIRQTKYVPAGGVIELTKADAFKVSEGKYFFRIAYYLLLNGDAPSKLFANKIMAGDKVLTGQGNITFEPTERVKLIKTDLPSVPVGQTKLTLSIDVDNTVTETDEANNKFEFTVIVKP